MTKKISALAFFLLCPLALFATAGNAGLSTLELREGGSTTTPTTGNVVVYAKADGLLYSKDAAGTESALSGGAAGGFTISLPPGAGVAPVSSTTYPAFSTDATSGIPYLAFDGATQEAVHYHAVTLPVSYDSAANVTFEIVVSSASASQATRWSIRVATVERAAISTAPGTLLAAAAYRSHTTSGTAGTGSTIAWTLSNADLDAAAAGDLLLIELARDAASAEDTSIVDVFVHTVRLTQ